MQGGHSLHAQMSARDDKVEAGNFLRPHIGNGVTADRRDQRARAKILLGVDDGNQAHAYALQGRGRMVAASSKLMLRSPSVSSTPR